jgi:hypothetical protein
MPATEDETSNFTTIEIGPIASLSPGVGELKD